eukprot:scaffold40708_cov23-Tisochrysis_lutea.AAC.1
MVHGQDCPEVCGLGQLARTILKRTQSARSRMFAKHVLELMQTVRSVKQITQIVPLECIPHPIGNSMSDLLRTETKQRAPLAATQEQHLRTCLING